MYALIILRKPIPSDITQYWSLIRLNLIRYIENCLSPDDVELITAFLWPQSADDECFYQPLTLINRYLNVHLGAIEHGRPLGHGAERTKNERVRLHIRALR